MKRESGRSPIHHFSFGERFDETMMKCHSNGNQSVRLSNHQFIGFSPLNKSAGKATEVGIAIRRLVGRTDFRPADRQGKANVAGEKKKATDNSRHHHRHLRRLLGSKKP